MDLINDFICFKKSKEILTSCFNNYYYKGPELILYSFYNYQKTITVITSTPIMEKNIIFAHGHPNQKKKV